MICDLASAGDESEIKDERSREQMTNCVGTCDFHAFSVPTPVSPGPGLQKSSQTAPTQIVSQSPMPTVYIQQGSYFSAFRNKDVAFFHVASKTLIIADLLFNLPANEQYSKSKSSAKVPILGKLDPSTSLHKKFVWSANSDRATMGRDAKTVLGWGMERAIMCHGDVIETGADKAWEAAYSKYFE
ncbi:hypothetical protein R3P38DRAFT_3370209 [Favolaschia claudopus]|uniref:Uncharacterized protein n=1 Tax=Favolaschia claudopus TaxID=2862362 RepID=A0AAW0A1E9_9AGAR